MNCSSTSSLNTRRDKSAFVARILTEFYPRTTIPLPYTMKGQIASL